jgi:hypothetical protein
MKHELAVKNQSPMEFDRKDFPDLIDGQINELNKLDSSVENALRAAENAEEKAEEAGEKSAKFGHRKAAIEELQSACTELAEAVMLGAKAQKISFEFQRKLAETTKFLFCLGVSNIAANQCVVRELELRLTGASKKKLSELARQELLSVVKQLKMQEGIFKRQEDHSKALKELDEKLKEYVQKFDRVDVTLKGHEALLKTEIESFKSSFAKPRKKEIGLVMILFLLSMAGVIFVYLSK